MTPDQIRFSIPLEPIGKGRPKATAIGGHARVYTPAKTRKFEDAVAVLGRAAMRGGAPLEGPLQCFLRFRMSLPKSLTRKRRAAILSGTDWYLGAYDFDNLAKATCDALNGICYLDDKQIVRALIEKVGAELPGIDILIKPAETMT